MHSNTCKGGPQAVLSEAGILKQLLLDLGGLLGPMLEDEYVVMGAFVPFLQNLVEEPDMAAGGGLFLAINLMKNHITSSEVCYASLVRPSHIHWPDHPHTSYPFFHVTKSSPFLRSKIMCNNVMWTIVHGRHITCIYCLPKLAGAIYVEILWDYVLLHNAEVVVLRVQMRAGLLHVMDCLSWRCRTAASVAPGAVKGGLQACLELVVALLHNPYVRDVWLAAPNWKSAFEGFLAIKAPSPRDLAACLPFVHWPDAEKLGMDCVSKEAYKRASRDLQAALAAVYERHSELCGLLLATPGTDTCAHPPLPSSPCRLSSACQCACQQEVDIRQYL